MQIYDHVIISQICTSPRKSDHMSDNYHINAKFMFGCTILTCCLMENRQKRHPILTDWRPSCFYANRKIWNWTLDKQDKMWLIHKHPNVKCKNSKGPILCTTFSQHTSVAAILIFGGHVLLVITVKTCNYLNRPRVASHASVGTIFDWTNSLLQPL